VQFTGSTSNALILVNKQQTGLERANCMQVACIIDVRLTVTAVYPCLFLFIRGAFVARFSVQTPTH
jgi:hypothetical protein